MKQIRIASYQRRPAPNYYSVERLYSDVYSALSDRFRIQRNICRYHSRGVLPRFFDSALAIFRQADVNHITGDVTYLAIFLKKTRTVTTVLDCIPLERYVGIKYWFFWFFWYWLPLTRSQKIIVISEATRAELIKHCPSLVDKIHVIHCPLNPSYNRVDRPFAFDGFRVLHIGAAPNKNLERHVLALKELDCTLVVLGSLSSAEITLIERVGLRYELQSGLSDSEVKELYISCDLLLFASTYEGFGLPILEAQAIGRPVVTSNILSMPEVAGEGGAMLVDPFSIDSIRQGVVDILSDSELRRNLVKTGFENINKFSLTVIGKQYEAIFQEVAARE